MKIELEDLGPVQKKLIVEIPADIVTEEIDLAYKTLSTQVDLPGFRKGKVPEKVIRQKYSGSILGDVASRLIESSFPNAIKEKDLKPVSRPNVDIEDIEEGKSFKYTATIDVRPEIDVKNYKDIKVKKNPIEATDKELEEALEYIQKSNSDFKEVDRPAKTGDLLVVDFEGFVEGEAIKSGKAENYQVVLGEGMLLPGFDEALVGCKIGDKQDVNTSFPDEYHEKHLSGKAAVFNVEIKSIKERILPVLDDEFAKDMDSESLDELKSKIADEIKVGKEKSEKEKNRSEAIDKLIESHKFEVPESLVENYFASVMTRVVEEMKHGHMHPDDKGLDEEKLSAKYKEVALRQARGDLIIDAISIKEDISATDDEVEKFVEDFAKTKNEAVGPMLAKFEKDGTIDSIKSSLIKEKVFDLIVGA